MTLPNFQMKFSPLAYILCNLCFSDIPSTTPIQTIHTTDNICVAGDIQDGELYIYLNLIS